MYLHPATSLKSGQTLGVCVSCLGVQEYLGTFTAFVSTGRRVFKPTLAGIIVGILCLSQCL